jgi:hypothetical protein
MRRTAARALALAVVLSAVMVTPALAATYRGAGVEDEAMPVKLKLAGRDVVFDYTDVLVECSDGSHPRQGGASHSDRLNRRDRFKDRLEVGGTTSLVKGKVGEHRARGTITYRLRYGGGECHSGKVKWKAKRK